MPNRTHDRQTASPPAQNVASAARLDNPPSPRASSPAADPPAQSPPSPLPSQDPKPQTRKSFPHRRPRLAATLYLLCSLLILATVTRLLLPHYLRAYVNRTIDKNPLYDGTIGAIDLRLLQGGYTIHDIQLNKTTGNVPVPFFHAKKVDLTLEWEALLARKLVGKIVMQQPQLNFVDSADPSSDQTGATGSSASSLSAANSPLSSTVAAGTAGPWLEMIRDLFPFKINSVRINDGNIHFRAFDTNPPVDVFLDHVQGRISNLTNIHDETTPLITRVRARAMAMGQAPAEFEMKLDPFSYRPTFQLAVRLIGLDVTQTNALARAYGSFDFERGFFDLVVEVNAKEGQLEGYVKPLFRHLTVLSLKKDIKEDNPIEFFWEALVGIGAELLKNQSRDQVGTLVPLAGDLTTPNTDVLTVVGNVLRNAFIRAYLPRFERVAPDVDWLRFGKALPNTPANPAPENKTDLLKDTKDLKD